MFYDVEASVLKQHISAYDDAYIRSYLEGRGSSDLLLLTSHPFALKTLREARSQAVKGKPKKQPPLSCCVRVSRVAQSESEGGERQRQEECVGRMARGAQAQTHTPSSHVSPETEPCLLYYRPPGVAAVRQRSWSP